MGSVTYKDYLSQAKKILKETPLIDGHSDFPFLLRQQLKGKIYDQDFLNSTTLQSHTDIRRMKQGLMGGQFWSVYVPNPRELPHDANVDDWNRPHPPLNEPNWAVRDTLEQIDVTKRMVAHYPNDLQLCTDQTGNSLGALRMHFESGVRYMTIMHNSDNVFGTSWISVDLKKGIDAGLTKFGQLCVAEMNRMGMMVDLSHVSPNTMRRALDLAKAPVIFSHSGAYGVTKHLRNAPDDVLLRVKENGGVVMVPGVTYFVSDNPEQATAEHMVDHIMYIAELIGWEHVGLGSDFDGTVAIVKGLEDTTKWPSFVARVLARGATEQQVKMLVGDNILRAWTEVERVAKSMQSDGVLPCEETWEHRLWEPVSRSVPQLHS